MKKKLAVYLTQVFRIDFQVPISQERIKKNAKVDKRREQIKKRNLKWPVDP